MKLVQLFNDFVGMAAAENNMTREEFTAHYLSEATVIMDAMDPESKDLAKLLKKNKVTMKVLDPNGPSGWPEVELTGKRKDLIKVLGDEDGWDDADLAEYITESKESEALADVINKGMIKIDDSMSYEDFALAVGQILRDEYGQHNFKRFMKVLNNELNLK